MQESAYPTVYLPIAQPRTGPLRLFFYGSLLGGLLITAAVLWTGVAKNENIGMAWFVGKIPAWQGISIGLLIGTLFAIGMWYGGRYIEGFIAIRQKIAEALDLESIHWWHAIALSVIAAVPEEIFFRGAMQPTLGLVLTALIFGALHAMTRLYFGYAMLAGLGLGLLANWYGNLWTPIAAHFAVNCWSLILLAQWSRSTENQKAPTH
ncbi:MAG: CPBP family intramembrane metalloprotease [Chloroflexi bacterium]|nr:CPBP family intramembrane metalloprotease [Chloroflexota bacterium]